MNSLLLIPVLPFLASILAMVFASYKKFVINITIAGILLTLATAIIIFCVQPTDHKLSYDLLNIGPNDLEVNLHLNHLAFVMVMLITFMSSIVHIYSARYMLSDATQSRFMAQLSLVTASVLFLVTSENLLTAFLGWQWIGMSLYLLLNHYHFDKKANKAAKKKFIINRLGDVSFLFAIIIAYQVYHTSSVSEITASIQQSYTVFGFDFAANTLITGFIFIAVMTKSAQFPFHFWLPDTMETPTPVSALMHAGIINAGGFLLTSISPLVTTSPVTMLAIFIVGVTTMLTSVLFIATQTDIKKQLAYSTMGQMGYMIMQCGLGCFSAAVFHLIAHGFYKASLFLNAGSALKNIKVNDTSTTFTIKCLLAICAYITASSINALGIYFIFGSWDNVKLNQILVLFLIVSLAQFTWTTLQYRDIRKFAINTITLTAIYFIYLYSIQFLDLYLTNNITDMYNTMSGAWEIACCMSVIALQLLLWMQPACIRPESQLSKRVYILSLNKLHVEEFFRTFLLNPLRKSGDICKKYLLPNIKLAYFSMLDIIIIFTFSASIYGLIKWHDNSSGYNVMLLLGNLILYIVMLVTTNRVKTFRRLFICLSLIQVLYINIGLFNYGNIAPTVSVFHLTNILLLFIPLIFLFKAKQNHIETINPNKNELPWLSIYTSIILILFIGLPGTAGFISEYIILYSLLSASLGVGLLFAAGIVLTAIVVLHLLQIYIFNPSTISRSDPKLSYALHGLCMSCIAFNVFNGVHPQLLMSWLA